ncbi:MAG TPA: hypothetical protein VFM14_03270 [Gemmatimonadales bacterium]|nr:hypothetical protein [Gemmatimonadales bacterium]
MTRVHGLWIGVLLAMALATVWFTRRTAQGVVPGIFIDNRIRLSLSQLQMTLWMLVVLSLLIAVFVARFIAGVAEFMDVHIPGELLIAMGISLSSGATAVAIKAGKDVKGVDIRERGDGPHLHQLYYVEEGKDPTPESVDVTRFQNLWLTIIVLLGYITMAWTYLGANPDPVSLTALPGFNDTLVTLFGISHAGYVAGKMPDRSKTATGQGVRN